jgi:hypothetical protein
MRLRCRPKMQPGGYEPSIKANLKLAGAILDRGEDTR